MWLSWTGFLAGLKSISNVETHCLLCSNTNVLIHSNLYSQSIPVSWNKKALRLGCLQQLIHVWSARFGGGGLLVRAWLRFILWSRCRWSICHAAIVLVRHLLTEKKTQVELSLRRSWSCWRSVWSGGSSQQTCYVNVCVLNSCVWCWEGKSSEGDRVCDFHQQKEMC